MIAVYWQIGELIVESEQGGKEKVGYRAALLEEPSVRSAKEYGGNFSSRNLRYIRQFYVVFPKWNAVRSELSWIDYRLLLKTDREDAGLFTCNKLLMTIGVPGHWKGSSIVLYFERMVLTKEGGRTLVTAEAEEKKESMETRDIIPHTLPLKNGIETE